LTAQRLANGNTFLANKDRVAEVDRAGKVVFTYVPPGGAHVMRARKLPGGDVLLVTTLGVTHFHRIDRFGRPVRSFPVEVDTSGGRLDVTPSGNVLIPEMNNNRVAEYDRQGRLVRQIRVAQPIACTALPNGHVIVTLMNENRAVELNRAGKQVWEYRRETRVTRAVRYRRGERPPWRSATVWRPAMFRRSCALLALGCALLLTLDVLANDLKNDLTALRNVREATDGPGLIAFFKKRTLSEEQREKIAGLIRQLGADEFALREKATTDLADLGGLCRAQLTQAIQGEDLEVRRRARAILVKLGPAAAETLLFAPAARVLADRRPEDGCKTLIDFLPSIDNADVAEEVARALIPLAWGKDGKPDPAVLAALKDRASVKRFAAGCAIARHATAEGRAPALELLKDADPGVRRRVALALLEARDKAGLPTLIALLTAATADDASAAEEALNTVAGEKAPPGPDGDAARAREAYRRGWENWWKENEAKLDLTKIDLDAVGRGFTLVITMDPSRASTGAVMELDVRGKVRWKVEHLSYPVHASMTRRDRVLVCEYNGNRVTERDLKGAVVWEKRVGTQLLSAERLPDGNTFIVTRGQLMEVDKGGNHVHAVNRLGDALLAGHRNKDGTYTVLTASGTCATLNSSGTQVRSFPVGFLSSGLGGVKPHFLPTGGVVLPDYARGEVREYDENGKLVKQFPAYRPTTVVKMANGHYLVASRVRPRIYEIDKNGREVSSRETDERVLFVDRR